MRHRYQGIGDTIVLKIRLRARGAIARVYRSRESAHLPSQPRRFAPVRRPSATGSGADSRTASPCLPTGSSPFSAAAAHSPRSPRSRSSPAERSRRRRRRAEQSRPHVDSPKPRIRNAEAGRSLRGGPLPTRARVRQCPPPSSGMCRSAWRCSARAEVEVRLHRLGRVHVHALHEPARLVRADR